jgi:hypothetical protein
MGLEATKVRVKPHPPSLKQGYKRLDALILLPVSSNHAATAAEHWNPFSDDTNGVGSPYLAINGTCFQV